MCWAPEPINFHVVSVEQVLRNSQYSAGLSAINMRQNPIVDFERKAYERVRRGSQMIEDTILAEVYRKHLSSLKVAQIDR